MTEEAKIKPISTPVDPVKFKDLSKGSFFREHSKSYGVMPSVKKITRKPDDTHPDGFGKSVLVNFEWFEEKWYGWELVFRCDQYGNIIHN